MLVPRWIKATLLAFVVLLGILLAARQVLLHHLRTLSSEAVSDTKLSAPAPVPKQLTPSSAASPTLSRLTSARLRALYGRLDPGTAAVEAADSDDPTIWAQSLSWLTICVDPRFTKDYKPEPLPPIGGFSAAEQQMVQARFDRYRDGPPMRLVYPAPFAQMINTAFAKKVTSLDRELDQAIEEATFAPMLPVEDSARRDMIEKTRELCATYNMDEFFTRYRAAHARWLAAGSTAAALKNTKAGWTSKQFSDLSDADYALVERIVRERQPDGLAKLLSLSISGDLRMVAETAHIKDASALPVGLAAHRFISALASCQLGVDDCSPQSPRFRDICVSFGGCHLDDLGRVLSYVLARDGLDPEWFNRESERVVKAVWNADLGSLGIRRASDKK